MRINLRFTMWFLGCAALAWAGMALYAKETIGNLAQAEEPVAISSNTVSLCEVFGARKHQASEPAAFEDLTLHPRSISIQTLSPADTSQTDTNPARTNNGVTGGATQIHSVVSGTDEVRRKHRPPRKIQFTCLMDQTRQPVYFYANEANGPDPVTECSANVATIGEAVPCLKETLAKEDAVLAPLESEAVAKATKVDQQWKGILAGGQMALSNTAWRQYRDQECLRREKFRAGGNHPDITRYACLIEKTRQRVQDFQEP